MGTHEALMEKEKGVYRTLYSLQFRQSDSDVALPSSLLKE
jgi:hypothetical protein